MRTVLSRSVLGAVLVTLSLGAGAAQAASTPGAVSVRVEGSSATLVPPTQVTLQPDSFQPRTDPSHSCSGTSAAWALEIATLENGTSWGGTFDTGFGDYLVNSIGGEAHPSGGDGSYWAFWYGHVPASVGVCQQHLNPNDQVLFFPDCYGMSCPAGFVSPNVLGMTAPTVAQRGAGVAVGVTSYANLDGAPSAASGATVSGGGVTATTNVSGAATLSFPSVGTFTVRASGPHDVPSEPHTICVHDGNDGSCGTPAPPGSSPSTTPPPATQVSPGLCLTANGCPQVGRFHPRGHLAIAEGARYRHGRGPRVLTGRVEGDVAGPGALALRLTRVVTHHRCQAFNAPRRAWVSARCGLAHAASFAVGRGAAFSYLLPARLGPGRYTLELVAADGHGSVDPPAPGRNEIVFRVA